MLTAPETDKIEFQDGDDVLVGDLATVPGRLSEQIPSGASHNLRGGKVFATDRNDLGAHTYPSRGALFETYDTILDGVRGVWGAPAKIF